MAKFHKGFAQNTKGANDAEFVDQFLLALPVGLADKVELTVKELFEVKNPKRFRTRCIFAIAAGYHNGMELEREGHGIDILRILSKISRDSFERIKAKG
jgi:hypothetical protein